MSNEQRPGLRLKPKEHKRLAAGHPWVYSNEVDNAASPLKGFAPGALVTLERSDGTPLGVAYVNPHSLIAARLLSRQAERPIDAAFFVERLRQALVLRRRFFHEPYYRLVFGESDGLPGLVVDRYDDILVAQALSAGIDVLKPVIEEALAAVFEPRGLLWRNDVAVRELEGLEREVLTGFGDVPEEIEVQEAGLSFAVDPRHGQKTGWFFDQTVNRQRLLPWLRDGRVLDLYSYLGAWSIQALRAGARAAVAVESSPDAAERIRANAERNRVADRLNVAAVDVDEYFDAARKTRERFDAVIVDPPALVKKARDKKAGLAAYRRINQAALPLVKLGGLLASFSCSAHVLTEDLLAVINQAARHVDREIQVLMPLAAGPDHPRHPLIAETGYLKGFLLRVLPAR